MYLKGNQNNFQPKHEIPCKSTVINFRNGCFIIMSLCSLLYYLSEQHSHLKNVYYNMQYLTNNNIIAWYWMDSIKKIIFVYQKICIKGKEDSSIIMT